ncbi:MAG: S41 family peptidase [Candidatus Zixiibacteriota bacterium]
MNNSPVLDRKSFLVSMILIVLIVITAGGMAVYVLSDPSISQALSISLAAIMIQEAYQGEVDWQALVESGRNAMLDKLDRYSDYVPVRQFENLDEELTGAYGGIGVSIIYQEDGLLIMSVRENGPAAEVGLLPGDLVTAADSVSFAELTSDKAIGVLRGEEGSKVRVTVYRAVTDETFDVDITRRRIPLLHVPFAGYTADSVLYIRVLDFEAGATEDIAVALDSLLEGRAHPRGLILDLRGNPGGLFAEAYETADLFLDEGVFMVGTDGRSRWNDHKFYAQSDDITGGLPMAVIVDRGSASSAEIVAGSLQASARAFLVGDTTFGKGLVQGFVRFPDGDGLKLTISRYYFAGPIYLNDFDSTLNDIGHGLVPDYLFDVRRMNPFRRKLENSLLMSGFANRHQDEIVEASQGDTLGDFWVRRFRDYAMEQGFSYSSPLTESARELMVSALDEKSSAATEKMITSVIDKSLTADVNEFDNNKDYIKNRLREIAYERKYGTYRTYKDVLLETRPEINFASQLLVERD